MTRADPDFWDQFLAAEPQARETLRKPRASNVHPSRHTYFISYAREDVIAADQVELALRRKKRSVWRDDARLKPGSTWNKDINKAIAQCHTFLVLWSRNWAASTPCRAEFYTAVGEDERLKISESPSGEFHRATIEMMEKGRGGGANRANRIVFIRLDDTIPEQLNIKTHFHEGIHVNGRSREQLMTAVSQLLEAEAPDSGGDDA